MVNRENVLRVADAIENHSIKWLGFNMQSYAASASRFAPDKLNGCGTVACLAGWTKAVLGNVRTERGLLAWERRVSRKDRGVAKDTAPLLGLDDDDASDLFHPDGWWQHENQTPAQAVAVLRHLAETGEVDWSIAPAPTKPEE